MQDLNDLASPAPRVVRSRGALLLLRRLDGNPIATESSSNGDGQFAEPAPGAHHGLLPPRLGPVFDGSRAGSVEAIASSQDPRITGRHTDKARASAAFWTTAFQFDHRSILGHQFPLDRFLTWPQTSSWRVFRATGPSGRNSRALTSSARLRHRLPIRTRFTLDRGQLSTRLFETKPATDIKSSNAESRP